MVRILGSHNTWEYKDSVGQRLGTLTVKLRRLSCYDAVGEARRVFTNQLRKEILNFLELNNDKVQECGAILDLSLFMVGSSAERAKPTVMLVSEDKKIRKEAFKIVKESGIMKNYPSFELAHIPLTAEFENFTFLASENAPSCDSLHIFSTQGGGLAGGRIFYSNTSDSKEPPRSAIAGGVVAYLGKHMLLTVNHFLEGAQSIRPVAAQSPAMDAADDDDDCEITGLSDFDVENEDDLIDATSRGSVTPEPEASDVEDSKSSNYGASALSSGSAIDAQEHMAAVPARLERLNQSVQHSPIVSTSRDHCIKVGEVILRSTELDYSLLEIDPTLLKPENVKDTIQLDDDSQIEPASRDAAVKTTTPDGGTTGGTLSGTPSYVRLPHSKAFIEVYLARFDRPLVSGNCGSWVRDAVTGCLFGHVFAGSPTSGLAMVMPASHVFEDARSFLSDKLKASTINTSGFGPTGNQGRWNEDKELDMQVTEMSKGGPIKRASEPISKAKKRLKVHNCECGRSYTRVEHLRRHQKNHNQESLVCDFPDCGKNFFRLDLLQRHQERHNEIERGSRRPSFISQGTTAESEAQISAPATLPLQIGTTVTQVSPYYPQAVSPILESTPDLSTMEGRRSYLSGSQTAVTIPVGTDGLQTGISWNDPFSQSPNYFSSSGYGSNRTRTSSNASFIEPWSYPSRSPTSETSTMAYTWTSNDKSPVPPNLPFMTTSSYPMTSVPLSAGADSMSGYMPFDPKSMAQRDQEEQNFLFPEQTFGIGIVSTYPYNQYLNSYWSLFHPSFPVVHRPTCDGVPASPMLHAAMIAIGAQYSSDPSAKRKSRILHDRCLKLLDKRDMDMLTEPERLCDYHALFLIEVLSQYRARRAAETLTNRFEAMYQKFSQEFRVITTSIVETLSALTQNENSAFEHWTQWINLSGQQRLLLCCYILEYQQATLLARQPQSSVIQVTGFDLPFPAAAALWDATNATEWAMLAGQYVHFPTYVYEVMSDTSLAPLDTFQSSLLIAAHYNHFGNPTPYLSPPLFPSIDHLLDASPITKHQLLTAKLLQVTPIRALLAVSGESWILTEKVPSIAAFSGFKITLKTWVNGLWASTTDSQNQAVEDALKLAVNILQDAMAIQPQVLRLELGADMGLYFAALVIWAVTVAANSRINPPHRYPSHSPLPSQRSSAHYPSTLTHYSANTSQPPQSPNPIYSTAIGLIPPSVASSAPRATSKSMLHPDITITSMDFINNAIVQVELLGMVPQWPRDVAQWQQGCETLMCWVKMRLQNGALEGQDSIVSPGPTSAGTGRGGGWLGDLLDGVVGVLERVMGRGWEGWSI
ncbi:hypothetical protein K469DRAFT_700233 [Zopfia rhizophila CBS 207.26]|uniref:C2H2-type domain-containing protein n=1 Tax=Zopfia rhizophila CBS 207.26 TaxID=1314779 RepID=A0A6A6DB24_9PEZI|nr:hypothetical protein K469DRAFT_700233 [Zopfia rhizophila CBS 207.26]